MKIKYLSILTKRSTFFLFFNTIRYLKFKQIFYQLYYKIFKVTIRPTWAQHSIRMFHPKWPVYISSSTVDGYVFNFFNNSNYVDSDWNISGFNKLWLYNLHYLDVLNSVEYNEESDIAQSLLARWIDNNPAPIGNGWEPYPLSLRIVNIVKWMSRNESDTPLFIQSLLEQGSYLEKKIEKHILGNHLFANGKALLFLGTFLKGPNAGNWFKSGLYIIDAEIEEQFLEDGAHFELSPMYHASMLWDLCDLVYLAKTSELPELVERESRWRSIITQGLVWMEGMIHFDGEIAFFNDSAFGIGPKFSDVESYANSIGCCFESELEGVTARSDWKLKHHEASGYVTVTNINNQHRAILDVAKVGPDYQPGHAHADTLSFELSLFGQRLIVNSGTSQYGEDGERHRQRSTQAHSTVEVDGENSSEVWGGFRVARRAYPYVEGVSRINEKVHISASHSGYRRLPGKVLHCRAWQFEPGKFKVRDKLEGSYAKAIVRFYCHPSVSIVTLNSHELLMSLESGNTVKVWFEGLKDLTVVNSTWHPRFGEAVNNQCVVGEFGGQEVISHFEWSTN